jgi:thiamine pyrophosphate-dependent acetolactate synthase large subunit-like protein
MGKKAGQKKTGKTLGQTKDQTPLLSLSGTRKVVRTPTNPFEETDTVEVFFPKEMIAQRIQDIIRLCRVEQR